MGDAVNHPAHYTGHPSGIECIQVTEHMNFCVGNAVKRNKQYCVPLYFVSRSIIIRRRIFEPSWPKAIAER